MALALGGGGAVVGARSGGGDCVDHERAVFAGGPGCLSACVECFIIFIYVNICEQREELHIVVG